MDRDTDDLIDQCIREAVQGAAAEDELSAPPLERFLRTGEETWGGAGSGRFTRAQLEQDKAYGQAAKTSLHRLFDRLGALLGSEARLVPPVGQESIRQRIEPMVRGLVQSDWQDVALRELTRRTFVLNFQGTRAALKAEFSTGWLHTAWQILWACFEDYGLKPTEIQIECDGLSGGEFAHVRRPANETTDPYSDVVVHEAAHLLHYLKPEHYGFHVRRGQERFVDVEFRQRELFAFTCETYSRVIVQGDRKARLSFAAKMQEDAFSFSLDHLDDVAALVFAAAGARNGWRVIREATVVRKGRKLQVGQSLRPAKSEGNG